MLAGMRISPATASLIIRNPLFPLLNLLPRAERDGKRYVSVDPAPPADASLSIDEHVARLLDPKIRLFDRYGNLFALRDIGSDEAVLGLSKVLLEDTSSAVLRHEIAFVLGQCANKLALPSLITSLENLAENQMVRHEAAEAIGAISEESATPLLQKYAKDENRVVAESCEIALDISDYNNDDTQFEYADVDVKSS
jgi:deoxyhypusine monooxygenase